MAQTLDKTDPGALVARLRGGTVFERFDDEQLRWVVDHADLVQTGAGEMLYRQGATFSGMSFLIEGRIDIVNEAEGGLRTLVSSTEAGSWAGGVPAVDEILPAGARTPVPSRVLRLDQDTSLRLVRDFPIAGHIVRGLREGAQRWQEQVDQQERLAALGRLSAGLAHELNNPAAAARRAAVSLPEAAARLRSTAVELALADPRPQLAHDLVAAERDLSVVRASSEPVSGLERSDREDALDTALRGRRVAGVDAAPMVDSGIDMEWLDRFLSRFAQTAAAPALRWLVAQIEVSEIARDVEDSTGRVGDLVLAIKKYTHMDRAAVQEADVHEGLDSTLAMLKYRLRGITVVRDYDRTLPPLPLHIAELNQVWTNLIDNAADAMQGRGTLTVRTCRDGDSVAVVIADDGPGIPAAVLPRIFEPFYTTKGVGQGTGLGLDIAHRIVAQGHGGTLQAESRPGDTRFTVRLPISGRAAR
ncbi:MAG TPA: ATP-binding protein [Candidatus Angelobacter sp.]|jgi:signal transduction histidine kinase|nr:ATP-binding protein [Candidatus Angelobacter sp.]